MAAMTFTCERCGHAAILTPWWGTVEWCYCPRCFVRIDAGVAERADIAGRDCGDDAGGGD
jgi:hypothetical protein